MPGFIARLRQELEGLSEGNMLHVVEMPYRNHAVWVGGAMLASLKNTYFVTKEEYDEDGFSVLRKFD